MTNMREYWAREAEMMRDKSGVLGSSSTPILSSPNKIESSFSAVIYDEEGNRIGNVGTITSTTQVYIASCKMLFPAKFKEGNKKMTVEEIVKLVGTETVTDRKIAIEELKLHVGIFKMPPKVHRNAIKTIIEDTHTNDMDYEIGGCGYHNTKGDFLHLRAKDGDKPSPNGQNPSVSVFDAIGFESVVDKEHQQIFSRGSKSIQERRVEYTWHTHPPKNNPLEYQQMPSIHDFNLAQSYDKMK
jgi:hypothetical protein